MVDYFMNDWFEEFSKQYFMDKYDYYYIYDHNRQLRAYKNIRDIGIDGNVLTGYIHHEEYNNNISIKFKEFSDKEKEKLNRIIDDNPINQFKIINKTLPEDLMNSGIKILPSSLDDLKIKCSCKDEEENLIDVLSILKEFNRRLLKNNFLIFKIRGIEFNSKKLDYPIKTIDDLFNDNFKTMDNDAILTNLHDANNALLYNVEYPTKSFNFIYDELFKLLNTYIASIPRQYNSQKRFIDFSDNTETSIKSKKGKNNYFLEKWNIQDKITLDIDDDYTITDSSSYDGAELFCLLNELVQTDIPDKSEEVLFLEDVLDLTYTLVEYYSLMPELFRTPESYQIRWIPSYYNTSVINYCKEYIARCPSNLVTFNGQKLSKQDQLTILISIIAGGLIKHTINKIKKTKFRDVSHIHFQLFTGDRLPHKKRQYKSSVESISRQLNVFQLTQKEYSYAMYIQENLDITIKICEDGEYKDIKDASMEQLINMRKIYDLFTLNKIENTIYEDIHLDYHDFLIFNKYIIELLPFVNVKLHNPYKIIHSNLDLILDIECESEDFRIDKIDKYHVWKIGLKDITITLREFDNNTDDRNEMIIINNKIYITDGYTFRHLKSYIWLLEYRQNSNQILQYAILEEFDDIKIKLSDKLRNIIRSSKIYEQPRTLNGQLRPYQKIGYSWLIQNIKSGFGSILADDMGLGKTLQVLASILYFKQQNPENTTSTLIIVPPTLLSNWQQEIEKFTPQLTYYIYHGNNRKYPTKEYDIILTSYSIIRLDIEMFLDKTWFICVIDEAQNIKNPGTKQTRAIKEIPAFNRIALTGTPIENRLTDYWSIFDFVNKDYLSTQEDFKTRYVKPIEKLGNEEVRENLKTIAKPFVLRRLKTDEEIRSELPKKFVNDIYCNLSKKQINLYEQLLNGIFKDIEEKRGIERKGHILKLITALKQTCNHPAQYMPHDKMKINESGKMELLANILETILDVDEKVLIFTQYVKMGEIIQKLISQKLKTTVLFLHGGQTRQEKTKTINTFQEKPEYKILVATLKTGGTGLNLTAAQNVIHYDLWWNPAVENQATDRVHRIGQEKDVMVYRFITRGTLEENIDQMLKDKTDLADKSISTDETFITELSNEELKMILQLRL